MILAFFSTNENYVIYRDINTGDVATRQLSLHLPSFSVSFVCTIYVQYCDQRRNEFFPQTENRR